MIWKRGKQRYTKKMRESPSKVQAKVIALNKVAPTGQKKWAALDGFNALTTVNFTVTGQANFNPGHGYPVKAFVNNVTGEIKLYSAYLFTY